ncbi:hypothetical protein CL634_01895 [bacterium]|nr:hypothetical protein [bacterium]|tara:strand:- start:1097 stop:3079 length:1983 start_codon:yes stop_codon:yes gene_type:complete
MTLTAFPNGVSSFGMPVMGSGPVFTTGNIFFVDSVTGSDTNSGNGVENALATIDAAVGKCTANKGDFIVVMPKHAESLAADSGVDLDVAGVTIVGMGQGADRPTITFDTAVTADFKLAAASVKIENLLFLAGIDALTGPIEVSADDCKIINCEYRDDAGNNYETTDVIVTTSTPLRMLIDHFVYTSDGDIGGTAQQSIIQLNGADHAIIRNCWLVAFAATGVIEDATVSDSILIENCVIENQETSPTVAVLLQATTSGTMRHTHIRVASGTTYITAGNDMQFYECYGVGVDADSGEVVGAIIGASVEGKIDTIQAELSGTAGIATFPEPATPADAVSMAEALSWISARNSVPGGINPLGSVYYVAASGGNDSATGGGLDPNEPLATIAQGITNGSAGDTIVLGPGTHSVDVSAAALIPLTDMRFVAAIAPKGGKPSTIVTADADDGVNLVEIDVDGVVFEGIEFLLVAGGTTALKLLSVAQTTAVNGLTLKDCWFNLNSVDAASVMAIAANDATNAITGLVVKNCRFTGGDGTTGQISYVQVGVGGLLKSVVEECTFELESADADCYGLDFLDNAAAANKSYGTVIRNNSFFGPLDGGEDGVGIFFAAAMTEKEIIALIHNNYFSYCSATPVTVDKMNKGVVNNYVGDNTAGGILVDPGT